MVKKLPYEELEQRVKQLEQAELTFKNTEEALRESEGRYRNLFENMLDGFAYCQMLYKDGRPDDFIYLEVNKAFGELTGLKNVVGKRVTEVIPGIKESTPELFDIYARVVETDSPERFEIDFTPLDIWLNISVYSPNKGYFVAVFENITDRKRTEGALRESETKFKELFDLSPQTIALTEVETGRLIDVNEKMCELTKYSREELIGRKTTEVFYSEANRKIFLNELKKSKEVHGLAMDFTTKDGLIINALMFSRFVKISSKTYILTIWVDVTKQKQLQDQLQQAQKMESIGTLAGGIAHDFNNILSPIMVYSEMVMMDLPSGSPLQQDMKQIYKAGERAGDLVKQILTFARKQEKERIPIKVSRTLKEAIKLLRSTIPTTIDIQYDINSEQDTVLSDPSQMNQIIMNLCTNAAHAMEEKGGTLEVILTNENLDSESANEFPNLEPGRYVKLAVKDTGQGIEPQFMDKIFEPYFTTKEVGKGTGMGLALVHGIVKSYGGVITVNSVVGKGTIFHVCLPLVEGDMDILETAKDSVHLPTGTERILFVDDEKAAVDVIQSMLEKLGYKVTARTSSIEALEAFRNNPQGFDLVITDMGMPNMTGKDLAKELMSIRPDIPIILCTGFSEQIDEKKTKEMGIRAFVMKPIVMRQIANTIREVLDNKQ